MARVRASAFALAACLLCLLNFTLAAPSDSQQVLWESEAEERAGQEAVEAEEAVEEERAGQEAVQAEEEERAGQEALQAEEAVEAEEAEGDADFSSLLQNEERAGTEDEPAGEQQQEQEQEQQQEQQRVWKPKSEGTLGRLSEPKPSAKPGDQQQDVEQEQRNQKPQDQNPRQDDFGLVGRQQPQPQGGQWPGQGGQGQRNPPMGYTQLSYFGHFKVHTTPRTWMEALLTCASEGGRLVVPSSAEETFAVGQLYGSQKARVGKALDRELFFIGAHDLIKQGDFVTIIGTKFKNGHYHKWQRGEPNNHGKVEHCVLSNDKGLYWDGNCQMKYAFVCEFKDPCKGVPRGNPLQQPPAQPQWPQLPGQGHTDQPNQQGQWPQQPREQQQGQLQQPQPGQWQQQQGQWQQQPNQQQGQWSPQQRG